MKRFDEMPNSDELISALETGRNRNLTTKAIKKQVKPQKDGEHAKNASSSKTKKWKRKWKGNDRKKSGHFAKNCPEDKKDSAKSAEVEEEFAWLARDEEITDAETTKELGEFFDSLDDAYYSETPKFALEAYEDNAQNWYLDSKASKHMTGNKSC